MLVAGKFTSGKFSAGRPWAGLRSPGPPPSEALQAARQHQHAGRFQKAEEIYRRILSAEPVALTLNPAINPRGSE